MIFTRTGSGIEQEELEAKHPLKSFYLTGGSTQLVNERKDDAQAKSTYSRVLFNSGMPPDLNVYPRPRGAIPRAALHTMGLYNLLDLSIEGIQQWAYLKASNEALKKEIEVLKSGSSRAKTGEQSSRTSIFQPGALTSRTSTGPNQSQSSKSLRISSLSMEERECHSYYFKSSEIPSGNSQKIERPVPGLLLLRMDNTTLLLSFLLAISFLKLLILQPQDVMTYSILTLATQKPKRWMFFPRLPKPIYLFEMSPSLVGHLFLNSINRHGIHLPTDPSLNWGTNDLSKEVAPGSKEEELLLFKRNQSSWVRRQEEVHTRIEEAGLIEPGSAKDDGKGCLTAAMESAALAAVLLPGLGGVVIGGAVALNSFFEMRIIDFFIAQARESICLRPDFLKWDSEKVEFSNPRKGVAKGKFVRREDQDSLGPSKDQQHTWIYRPSREYQSSSLETIELAAGEGELQLRKKKNKKNCLSFLAACDAGRGSPSGPFYPPGREAQPHIPEPEVAPIPRAVLVPELERPLLPDIQRRAELQHRLSFYFIGRNEPRHLPLFLGILEKQFLLEKRVEAALVGDGFPPQIVLARRSEIRNLLFNHPTRGGAALSENTLNRYDCGDTTPGQGNWNGKGITFLVTTFLTKSQPARAISLVMEAVAIKGTRKRRPFNRRTCSNKPRQENFGVLSIALKRILVIIILLYPNRVSRKGQQRLYSPYRTKLVSLGGRRLGSNQGFTKTLALVSLLEEAPE
ncbi:hypothetical protein KY285_024930 [Solanum tuberosum]|nr:hypothetical protein KY289_024834 [Solanum tuberosum]KAH0677129.1 hypothetical protein KY285_024930 [Solanum tuberosum]KAH0696912.1 hypothetical protein KY289_014394 [Solanum tuberosum]